MVTRRLASLILNLGIVGVVIYGGLLLAQTPPATPPLLSNVDTKDTRCWTAADGKAQTCVPVSVLRLTFPTYTTGQPPPTVEYQQSIHDLQVQLITSRDQVSQLQKALLNIQQGEIDAAYVSATPPGMKWDKEKRIYVPVK